MYSSTNYPICRAKQVRHESALAGAARLKIQGISKGLKRSVVLCAIDLVLIAAYLVRLASRRYDAAAFEWEERSTCLHMRHRPCTAPPEPSRVSKTGPDSPWLPSGTDHLPNGGDRRDQRSGATEIVARTIPAGSSIIVPRCSRDTV